MISNTVLDYICDQLIKKICVIIILRKSKLLFLSKVIHPVQSEPAAEIKVQKSIVSRLSSKLEEYAQPTFMEELPLKIVLVSLMGQ